MTTRTVVSAVLAMILAACGGQDHGRDGGGLTLESPAFKYGRRIPDLYTCNGGNISPELVWKNVPAHAKSLILICEDLAPDTNLFLHWVVYDIPPTSQGLPRDVPKIARLPDGSRQGYNGKVQLGYFGPCPGSETHRYVFELYALDTRVDKDYPLSGREIISLVKNHIIAKSLYLGIYR